MNEEEDNARPRLVNTVQYVRDRIEQITDLLEVVDNSALNPGEVTSGPRTVFQRLPRHMRRRAMSHNVKRLPRSVQHFASKSSLALHRKKAPSRKWRRRPSRLLKKLQRISRQNVWLETHIWHAKRFRMADLWDWKLPVRSFQRGFRPTYRNASNATVVFDLSYFCCTQISVNSILNGSKEAIIDALSEICNRNVSPSFSFRPSLENGFETSALVYEPGKYPHNFIGPVRFSWAINQDNCSLQMWAHPSVHSKIVQTVVGLTAVNLKNKPLEHDNSKLKPSDIKKLKVPQQILVPSVYESEKFTVTDLRHDLVRIRLIGPKLFSLLASALHLVSDSDLSSLQMDQYHDSHKFWREVICANCSTIQAGNFCNGTTISLMVEDPRLFRGQNITKSLNCLLHIKKRNDLSETFPSPPPPILSFFWNNKFRHEQFEKRLDNAQLERERSEHLLGGLSTTPYKIPILLIIQSVSSAGNSSASAAKNRVDLITPGGTGMDFWLALQFANGRAAGVADKISLDFESNTSSFPADCADSKAALEYAEMDANALRVKHFKKPHNRRLKYEGRLSVKHPFTFNWPELISNWIPFGPSPNCSSDDKFFIIRDKRILMKLNAWLKDSNQNTKEKEIIEKIFQNNANALVAVKLSLVSRGRLKRLALICIPTPEDLAILKTDKAAIIEEPKKQRQYVESKTNVVDSQPKTAKSGPLSDFMPLKEIEEVAGRKVGSDLVSLNDLFPDEELVKKKRKLTKKLKRKETVKKRKLEQVNAESHVPDASKENICTKDTAQDVEEQMDIESQPYSSYRESCSRLVAGRVVRGDYSFLKSSGAAFGFCPLNSLPFIKETNKIVLLRNTTSKFYHAANISINMFPSAEL